MKRMPRSLSRFLSAGLSLALLAGLMPGASAASSRISYDVDSDDVLELDRKDFDEYCYNNTPDGQKIEYIRFTDLPSSSKGVLYLDYGTSREEEVEEDDQIDADEIDDLSFVPDEDFEGVVTLFFEGKADSRELFEGEIAIDVGGDGVSVRGDVTYDMDTEDELDFDVEDFNDYCWDETGSELDTLWFNGLPSSNRGILYYDYYDNAVRVEKEDDVFRYREIDDLTFVSDDWEGSITIPFEIRSEDADFVEGELVINIGTGSSSSSKLTIKLETTADSTLDFDPDVFNEACLEETKANLDYVTFDFDSGRSGSLYYLYEQSGTSKVGSEKYYRSSRPNLSDVTFVPGTATNSTVRIPFSGKATNGKSFSGNVEISFVTLNSPTIIRYTSNGLAVSFRSADFTAACAARGGKALSSVRFSQPNSSAGKLYFDFDSPTKYRGLVEEQIDYGTTSGYLLDNVVFLPKAGYTGTVTVQYTGTDASGLSYTGNIQIIVTPPTTSKFTDMDRVTYSWAIPSVEFMAAYGITTGTGTGTTFSPAAKLTRGDYVLMLCRTFDLTSTSTSNFTDVPANSYYASALATAKALGIIEADSKGAFHPTDPVTRQDACLFLYRAMQKAGRTLPTPPATYLNMFKDGSSVADYAKTAMASLAMQGVIQGDQLGNINPTGTLSRAEMAVMLHRALTL